MVDVPLVVGEAGERGMIADACEQLTPAGRNPERLAIAAEVHEGVHEPNGAATALANSSGSMEPTLGAPIGFRRGARLPQAPEDVSAQTPQLSALRVVRVAHRGGEAAP